MATSILKKITAEAKLLRKQNPKLKWTSAIKKASEFYKGTVKPVAKKTYKKTKAVVKAGAKGVAVARRSYARSMAGTSSKWCVVNGLGNYLTRTTLSGPLKFTDNPEFAYTYTEEEAKAIAKGLSNSPSYASDLPIKAKPFTYRYMGKISKKTKPARKSKVGAVKKIAFKRTGKGGSKLGSVKKVGKPQIKPIKPTFAILNKQNPAFLSSLVDHSTKPKSKILVYSPLLNKYIIVVKYVDMYTVYIVSPAQTIRYSELFRVVGTHKATLDRINKKYDIDLIP